MAFIKDLRKSKTFWLAVATILGTGEELARGQITAQQAAVMTALALGGIFIRHAIHKIDPDKKSSVGKQIGGLGIDG